MSDNRKTLAGETTRLSLLFKNIRAMVLAPTRSPLSSRLRGWLTGRRRRPGRRWPDPTPPSRSLTKAEIEAAIAAKRAEAARYARAAIEKAEREAATRKTANTFNTFRIERAVSVLAVALILFPLLIYLFYVIHSASPSAVASDKALFSDALRGTWQPARGMPVT